MPIRNKIEKSKNGENVGIVLNSDKKGKRNFSNQDGFWKTLWSILARRR